MTRCGLHLLQCAFECGDALIRQLESVLLYVAAGQFQCTTHGLLTLLQPMVFVAQGRPFGLSTEERQPVAKRVPNAGSVFSNVAGSSELDLQQCLTFELINRTGFEGVDQVLLA